jgi:hypothetical protein
MLKYLAALAAPLLVLTAAPAEAGDDKHRHHRHHGHWQGHHHKHHWHGHGHRHRHSSASIVIWSGPAYRPYYPPVVYAPPPPRVVYAPAPVVYAPQVAAVPTRDFRDAEGRYCREYQRTAVIDGRDQQIYGTACLMPDGAWRIVAE